MAYSIVKYKAGRWALFYRLDKGRAGKESRIIYADAEEFKQLGLNVGMTLDEAREALKRAQVEVRREARARKRHAIELRLAEKADVESAYLPGPFVEKFEKQIIPRRRLRLPHWHAARAYVVEAAVSPTSWHDEADLFYSYLERDKRSPDYSKRIIRVLNEYGWEYCKAFTQLWRDIPLPSGDWRGRIKKAFRSKLRERGRFADCPRLDEALLYAKRAELPEGQYRWLHVALWFGLRPREANALARPGTWSVTFNIKHQLNVLTIIQSKLDDTPKQIPILYPEQEVALAFIKQGNLCRPLIKTVRHHLGAGLVLYSCRKSFVNLMHDRGHSIVEISRWLGHENIDTTMRYYWDIREVVLENKSRR